MIEWLCLRSVQVGDKTGFQLGQLVLIQLIQLIEIHFR